MTPILSLSSSELMPSGNEEGLVSPSEPRILADTPMSDSSFAVVTASNTNTYQQPTSDPTQLGVDALLGSFEDNFATFMDYTSVLSNPFSPSYQPLHALFPELTLPMAAISGNDDPGLRLNGELFCDYTSSETQLPPFASRLQSLQPEEAWLQRPSGKERSKNHHAVSPECRERLVQGLAAFSNVLSDDFVLPSRHTLSRLIAAYISAYHKHYPFIHVPTLQLQDISEELFLAIAGMGARYCREPEIGTGIFHAAKSVAMERIRRQKVFSSIQKCPHAGMPEGCGTSGDPSTIPESNDGCDPKNIELIQALLLIMAIATWFHIEPSTYEALSIRGALDTLIRKEATRRSKTSESRNWYSWIDSEMFKRTRMVAFCIFNIHTIVYDLPPMMLSSELDSDLPCSERQWEAENETAWSTCPDSNNPSQGFQETFKQLFKEDQRSGRKVSTGFSSLGGSILIHAVIQRIWLVRNARLPDSRGSVLVPDEINKFERALKNWSWNWEHDQEKSIDSIGSHGPLSFTSTTLLRLAYIRINMDLGAARSLSTWDPNLIVKSLDQSPNAQRSEKLTRAALHCAHALSIPVKLGIRLVAQTQVIYWSNQHALCSLECAVLLVKWLEAVTAPDLTPPLTPAERRVLEFLAQLVAEADYKQSVEYLLERKQLISAALVRLWATLYTYDSAWDMVDLIGRSLTAYAELLEARHGQQSA